MLISGCLGGLCGLMLGLPSLRLPGFYFAMATMAFSLIVNELVLAQKEITGGGIGLPGPLFNAPFDSPVGFYYLVLGVAAVFTWVSLNIVNSMWGRALISIRDSEVAAQAMGVPIFRAKLIVFVFSGFAAGVSGALFASLQSYITPDTFVFELSLFFFVCIIIGGKGSIFGPFIGTVVLTALPELAAPLAKLGNLFYGLLLLIVVLVIPEGIGKLMGLVIQKLWPTQSLNEPIIPDLTRLSQILEKKRVD
jgi:branched-chain amino acid transport system permease protein